MKSSYFSRDLSSQLKGVALLLMFIHHFFTFPDWIVCGVEYPWLQTFADIFCAPTDLCVALFAFLTGYFFFFSKGSISYSVKKISDFLLSYWMVCLPLILLAVLSGSYTLSGRGLLGELTGMKSDVMSFCWYVYFFCIIMLLLPLLTCKKDRSPAADLLVLLVLPTVVINIWFVRNTNSHFYSVLWNLRQWYPNVPVGYLFAKYDLFNRFDGYLSGGRERTATTRNLTNLALLLVAFMGRYYFQGMYLGSVVIRGGEIPLYFAPDIILAPLFLYAGKNLLERIPATLAAKALGKIGQRSMLMWFYHCIFFNCCKSFTQILLYWPKNPLLVLLNGLLLCYAAAVLTEPVRKILLLWKQRLWAWLTSRLPVRTC